MLVFSTFQHLIAVKRKRRVNKMEVSETYYVSIQRESNFNVCDLVKKMVGSIFSYFPRVRN